MLSDAAQDFADFVLFAFLAGYFGCLTRCTWKSGMQQNALSIRENAASAW